MNQILNNSFFKWLAISFLLAYATGKGMSYSGYAFDPFYSVLMFILRAIWAYTLVEMIVGQEYLKKAKSYLIKLVRRVS
ncbi:TPA: hypothetical protein JAN57_03240 [Legionella pneumophila]|nr:hypothetical protein [Legionella pneumophila]HAU1656327.1 hypothetical protein [Legionella pneumophila]